ncbi:Protein TALPID3 [Nibea albiflora]|uniref:Protein TALPID3 n=1 Tax=Nibea albiflora TaxID=240163 RepID=A0ACB7FEV3_NIBAL|nr:Protein TALPID3 [Nibea albiflora]
MLEDAGRVLRQVQRQKKVLEENLEALLRARTGEVLYCQLEALAANSDWTEEVRIKQTVDAWINTLTEDIQGVEPDRATHRLTDREQVEAGGESYLSLLYGRAPYEGLRRTLKKSPYLRFSSPASLLSRKPRPRLVESVRGVKVKSCKTQTSLAPPLSRSPERPQHHDIISPSPADLTVTPAERYSVATAIPLGCPRMDSSRCVPERQQEVTSPPTAPPTSSVVAMDHELQSPLRSEVRSQRSLTGEFVSKVEQLGSGEAKPLPPDEIIAMKNGEEENIFPGTDFLSVADVQQVEQSIVGEEAGLVGEEVVQLDGGPSPPPVLYQGPVFPPQARSALHAQDEASVLGLNLQRNALETRMVEWVEQQLISRMISEIHHPPPCDPAQNDSTDQSELSKQSVTSDIVEAAGGAGLQLFVDCSLSVDSALIRQLVDEVLTEHIALMLGHRDALETGPEPQPQPPKPGPRAHEEERPVLLLPTPEPTPPPSPTPPSRETTPLTTPPPSEPTSLLNEEFPQPITAPDLSEATNQDLVTVGDLMVEPVSTLTSDFQTDRSLTPLPHLEDAPTAGQVLPVVNQLDSPAGVSRRAGLHSRRVELHSRRVELHLPSSRLDDESVADSDSSTNL